MHLDLSVFVVAADQLLEKNIKIRIKECLEVSGSVSSDLVLLALTVSCHKQFNI